MVGAKISVTMKNSLSVVIETYELLKRIGMTWITARCPHPKADLQTQKDFKKTLPNDYLNHSQNILNCQMLIFGFKIKHVLDNKVL